MAKKFNKKIRKLLWEKLKHCKCGEEDCKPNNHRLCSMCGKKILWGSYIGSFKKTPKKLTFVYDVDHIIPVSEGGTNKISNLRLTHVTCNRQKSSRIITGTGTDLLKSNFGMK